MESDKLHRIKSLLNLLERLKAQEQIHGGSAALDTNEAKEKA